MKLITSFTALVFIIKFEDDYMNCIQENLIKDAIGKKLATELKRRDYNQSVEIDN